MKLLTIFDYTYYRLATIFYPYEKENNISLKASMIVSLTQMLIVMDIVMLWMLESMAKAERLEIVNVPLIILTLIFMVVYRLNDRRYANKRDTYQERWGKENDGIRTVKGFLVFLLLLLPLIFLPLLVNIKDYTQ